MTIDPKVAATAMAGAATIVLVWLAHAALGLEVPGEVGSALTVLLGGVVGYFKKPTGPARLRRRDRPLRAR